MYPKAYTASVSTRVSNAPLFGKYTPLGVAIAWSQLYLGPIIGQLFVGVVCDRIGRKVALVFTTLLIVLGATLATAAHGAHGSAKGLFWFLTFARGITGIVRADAVVFCSHSLPRVSAASIPHRLPVPARRQTRIC